MAVTTPPTPATQTVTVSPSPGFSVPSTWLIAVGTVLEGADVATAAAHAGLSPSTVTLIAVFGGFLIGLGAWLSQHGH